MIVQYTSQQIMTKSFAFCITRFIKLNITFDSTDTVLMREQE